MNYDVLLNVIENAEEFRTALTLTSTCHFLRQEGSRIILKRPISITCDKMALSFMRFLSGGQSETQRFKHLHNITLDLTLLPRHAFLYAVHLESLKIRCADYLFWDTDPSIYTAIAGLRLLKHLEVDGVDRKACNFLRTLVSPLQTVLIDFCPHSGDGLWDTLDEHERPLYHPTILLENFTESLEELEFRLFHNSTGPPSSRGAEYLRLRQLHIQYERAILSTPYIRAFPNLASLHVTNDCGCGNEYLDHTELREHRNFNLTQNALLAHETGTAPWPQLPEFTGYIVDLYLLGLICRIPRLTVKDSASNHGLHMLKEVLRFACPVELYFESHQFALDDVVRNLADALCMNQASNIANLSILLGLRSEDREVNFTSVLEDLEVSMAALQLQHFKFTCLAHGLNPADNSDPNNEALFASILGLPPPPPRHPRPHAPWTITERTLESYDLEGLAMRLVDSNPSIQSFELAVELPHGRGSRIARLDVADEVRRVVCESRATGLGWWY